MAKKVIPLTNTQVKLAKAQDKECILSDGDGLQLKVKPSGSKIWVFKYSRPFTKKSSNIGVGVYPEVFLSQARVKRKQVRELLAQDVEPKAYKDVMQERLIRLNEVIRITDLSRSRIYQYISEGKFLDSVFLSGRPVAWVESEIVRWVDNVIK